MPACIRMTFGRYGGVRMRLCWLAAAICSTMLLVGCGGGSSSGSQGPTLAVAFSPKDLVAYTSPDNDQSEQSIQILVSGTDGPLWVGVTATMNALTHVEVAGPDLTNLRLGLHFKPAGVLPNGVHTDQIQVDICEDAECAMPIAGSPFQLSTTLNVSGSTAVSMPVTLPAPARPALTHDVVAAAMSRSLNALVMVGTLPDPAMYLYDLATGKERRVALSKPPTALTLSLDGRKAAVGHDARVTWIDLPSMKTSTPSVTTFDLPVAVFDLVVDGGTVIHAFPASGQWVDLHSIDVVSRATWTTHLFLYEGTRARLHPSGDSFYMVDTRVSPQNLERVMLAGGGVLGSQRSAPYWGDYEICSDFWMGDAGDRIYSACGNGFVSSTDVATDMLYAGRLPVIPSGPAMLPVIVAFADSSKLGQLAFLDTGPCSRNASVTECETYLRLTDATNGQLLSTYWAPPVGNEQGSRRQRGVFLGYASDGTLYMISRLIGESDASRAFYISAPLQERAAPAGAQRRG